MQDLKWFNEYGAEKLLITQYQSLENKEVLHKLEIQDEGYISGLQDQIDQLPVKGKMMKEMAASASYMTLEFITKGKSRVIELYDKKIKTPDHSFLGNNNPIEKLVSDLIDAHLQKPELGLALPLAIGIKKSLGTFSIEYLGHEDRTPPMFTASWFVESFKVTDLDGNSQVVEVSSGQLPPMPTEFKVGKKSYFICTLSTKSKNRIPPLSYIIEE